MSEPDGDQQDEMAGVRAALEFIGRRVLERRDGRRQTAEFIAARLVVLVKLFADDERSLHDHAQELGVSVSSLSKIAREFSGQLGLQASWQRARQREPVGLASKHLLEELQREKANPRGFGVDKSPMGKEPMFTYSVTQAKSTIPGRALTLSALARRISCRKETLTRLVRTGRLVHDFATDTGTLLFRAERLPAIRQIITKHKHSSL